MEDITNADYKHGKRVWKNFKRRNQGDYHDLYVQGDTLLLGYILIFATKVLKYMSLLQLIFFSTYISMAGVLKNTEIELELLTDTDVLLMVKKGVRGGISHAVHR